MQFHEITNSQFQNFFLWQVSIFVNSSMGKGGFFSESSIHFLDLQISKKKDIPKNYPELEI